MKKWTFLALVGMISASAVQAAGYYVPGELIVKYKDGAVRERAAMNTLYKNVGVEKVRRYRDVMKGFEVVTLRTDVKMGDAIKNLEKNKVVEYAQPNYYLYATPMNGRSHQWDVAPQIDLGEIIGIIGCMLFPDLLGPLCDEGGSTPVQRPEVDPAPAETNPAVADPDSAKVWGVHKIGSGDVWKTHKGSKDMIVAVIDTGVDYNHEDLSFNMWRNPNPANKDIVGFDFVHNDGLPYDDQMHGTHVAGTIGATGGNGKGIVGVNQRVSIMALKFLTAEGSGTTADAIKAIDYAIANGAKVLNNSWGGKPDPSGSDAAENKALEDAVNRTEKAGVLFVAAAGNGNEFGIGENNDTVKVFPAGYTTANMISVAATDKNDKLTGFSNYGKKTVHLAAPGDVIWSTLPGGKYGDTINQMGMDAPISGTSMACPHVAGAAALVWSHNPTWDYKQVKAALLNNVDQVTGLSAKTVSGGRLNVAKAFQ